MPNFALIGAQRICLNVIDYLDKNYYDIKLIVQDATGNFDGMQTLPPFLQLKKQSGNKLYSKFQTILVPIVLAKQLNKIKPDVVISISPWMNFVLLSSTYFLGKHRPKIIIEEHQHLSTSFALDPDSHSPLMRFLYKRFLWMYKRANIIRCVSQASKKDLSENWKIDKEKIFVLNPTINIAKLCSLGNEPVPSEILNFVKNSKQIILGIGRLEAQKDYYLLVDSFGLVLKDYPEAKLIIAGYGKLERPLKEYVKVKNLESSIFIGFIQNPFPLFKIANLFCLTSIWEGMPVVIMEAMALNCPVVSVDCPSGPSEMIENHKSGLLVLRDAREISNAIEYIFSNPMKAKLMAEVASQNAQKWDVSVYVDKLGEILKNNLKVYEQNHRKNASKS